MVIWVIGLSGSGKTTFSREIVAQTRGKGRPVVLLDGDELRDFFGNDLGYSLDDRRTNGDRICRMFGFLDDQGIDVVCAAQSLFPDLRDWCRHNLSSYYEIFIDAPMDQLMARDSKGIYSRYERGEIRNVAGLDLEFPRPVAPDLLISNTGSEKQLLDQAEPVVELICAQ